MNLDVDAAIERWIGDDFQDVPTISATEFIEKLSKAFHAHGGQWPKYATASFAQVRLWETEVIFPSRNHSSPKVNRIMNTRIIERPGPVTLIWSEQL